MASRPDNVARLSGVSADEVAALSAQAACVVGERGKGTRFPSLSCLSLLADRVLRPYLAPQPRTRIGGQWNREERSGGGR